MLLTRTTVIRSLKFLGIVVLVGLIFAFVLSRTQDYLRGPYLEIFEPVNGSAIASSTVAVSGRVQRVNGLFLNGEPVSTDEQGRWRETIVVFPGLNKITLIARDRFDRKIQQELDLFGTTELP